jgi:hypothetical protein
VNFVSKAQAPRISAGHTTALNGSKRVWGSETPKERTATGVSERVRLVETIPLFEHGRSVQGPVLGRISSGQL